MQGASQLLSPTVRVHSATPTADEQDRAMIAHAYPTGGWVDNYSPRAYLSALPRNLQDTRFHKRNSSGSSVASAGPPSPLSQNTLYPQIATSDPHYSPTFDFDYQQTPQSALTSKSLPTPTSDSVMYPGSHHFAGVDMRRNNSAGADERASYALSGPQSASTMSHNSPATPQTNYDQDFEDSNHHYGGKVETTNDMLQYLPTGLGYHTVAYQQSLQDVFPDQTFSSQGTYNTVPPMQRMAAQQQRQSMMADRLQAAQQDHLRVASPAVSGGNRSPFRQSSPYMPPPSLAPQPIPQLQKTRTSVSPKELMLDEHDVEESAQPLIASQHQQYFGNRRHQSSNSFYMPSLGQHSSSIQSQQQFPIYGQGYSQDIAQIPEATPEFPAHMISMESTAEEGPSEPSSQQSMTPQKAQPQQKSQPTSQPISRPVDTSSDAGTYSCTYHGCSMRFDSPSKLQKHKREGHRQTSPSTPTSIDLKNSQAGPHRCDRINPSTGKPCNSVFSRPYDLTRHEDTIHNARKLKVRCPHCTDEKSFSRADALTRHLRVVHPDIPSQMKQKRARK